MTRWTCLAALVLGLAATSAHASDAQILSPQVIFVTSTGYWEESAAQQATPDATQDATPEAAQGATTTESALPAPLARKGYYKLIALRAADGTGRIHLQQIAVTPEGPQIVSSAELEEFSALNAYVTDIRPESSTGVTRQPGLFATVYLKTDPTAIEPDTWTVLIDDLGDIKVEPATN